MLLDRERDRRSTPAVEKERAAPGDRALVCAVCGHAITDEDARIAMSGGHEHTFVNPGGFAYTIGCFARAPGLALHARIEAAFSWFPGWTWQVAGCTCCQAHLGWAYRNSDAVFYGLNLDRLTSR